MRQITIKLSLEELEKEEKDIVINIDEGLVMTNRNHVKQHSLFNFMEEIIENQNDSVSLRTSETYRCTLNSFKRYRENEDVDITEIDNGLIEGYEMYLKKKNISLNTISFYMRILRTVYNKAVENGITDDRKPFKNVYTSIGKTVKRAVDMNVIRGVKDMACPDKDETFARDMFMFSFYTRGMSFVDMAYLKKSDIHDGMLIYKRKKTQQELFIRWDNHMQQIVDRYPSNTGIYLLPIISKINGKERNQYRYKQYLVNENLKKISESLNLNRKLTMYVARHSWASIALAMNVPIDVISRGMGHNSEKTTRIYLKTIDSDTIDKANALIIGSLNV